MLEVLKNQGPWGGKKPSGGNRPNPSSAELDELLKKSREQLKGFLGGGNGGGAGSGGGADDSINPRAVMIILLVVLVGWLSMGLFIVDEREQGVVLRFGEFHRVVDPGINYHLPSPIEKLIKVPVTVVNRIEIGQRTLQRGSNTQIREVPEESSMLTGDENIVDVPFEVQWLIRDAGDFLFNVRDPEETVKSVAESAMREIIGRTPISQAIADGKFKIQQDARNLLQKILDEYKTGIQIDALELGKIKYPSPVRPAFTDVQNAKTEAESAINKAQAYRNDIIPRARGQAERMNQAAEGYAGEVVAQATGQAKRFISVYNEYKRAKDVTRKRMYMETMETIMQGMDKILIDQNGGNGVVPYLPLNELKAKTQQ